jgi:GR25 family glycosyltransferase involved in LPS biosynthesis
MTTDKPPVIIIRNKDDDISEYLASKARISWERLGFDVEYFDAVTPETLDQFNYLNFGDEILMTRPYDPPLSPWRPLRRGGEWLQRKISDSEKSVYYSHFEVWKVILERDVPCIVVEHDGELNPEIDSDQILHFIKNKDFRTFNNTILRCSYYTPKILEEVFKFFNQYNLGIGKRPRGFMDNHASYVVKCLVNVDGWLTSVIQWAIFKKPSIHRKVGFYDRPKHNQLKKYDSDHELYRFKKYFRNFREVSGNWLVKVDKSKSTIDHRNHEKIKQKVAVLIGGDIPNYLHSRSGVEHIFDFLSYFKGCDLYWNTWHNPEDDFVYERLEQYINLNKIEIDPDKPINPSTKQYEMFEIQWKDVPKEYDFYIRIKWETVFHRSFENYKNILNLIDLAKNKVVGVRANPNHDGNHNIDYVKFRDLRVDFKKRFEEGHSCVDNDAKDDELNDYMIVFKESDLNGLDISELYNSDESMSRRQTWYNMLCQKRSRINIDGLVSDIPDIDHRYETYRKLGKL